MESLLVVMVLHCSAKMALQKQSKSESVSLAILSDSAIPWTMAHQAPLSMEFSRQEFWNGLPFPSPWDLPNPGIKPGFPLHGGRIFTIWATREVLRNLKWHIKSKLHYMVCMVIFSKSDIIMCSGVVSH